MLLVRIYVIDLHEGPILISVGLLILEQVGYNRLTHIHMSDPARVPFLPTKTLIIQYSHLFHCTRLNGTTLLNIYLATTFRSYLSHKNHEIHHPCHYT